MSSLLELAPVPTLIRRARDELAADFDFARPVRVSRAPGRLDVMGGIADYTGSTVCEAALDRAAAVLLQERDDRFIQVFSFNLFDEHRPFTARVPIQALATNDTETLRKEFNEPGRKFAGYVAGCLNLLHREGFLDLADESIKGMNLAVLSTVPLGAGVSSSAALEVATMMNLVDHFGLRRKRSIFDLKTCHTLDAMKVAAMCQAVENQVVGAPCGIMDQVSSTFCETGKLMRMVCQPHEVKEPVPLPAGVRAIGINSNVKHSVGGGQYGKTRCAAFMGHAIILATMKKMAAASGKELVADPMRGYLANLNPDDYKTLFRPHLPDTIKGGDFLLQFGKTIDAATRVEVDTHYSVQRATDHHVLESMRVKNFCKHLENAEMEASDAGAQKLSLDKAGHLMYASHLSYTNDALLGADECDLLVKLVRDREPQGFYGAKITGGGSGGTVAILCRTGEPTDAAIAEIMAEYEKQTGLKPEAFTGSSPGAWHAGTATV